MRNYCTLFDSKYTAFGLSLYRSLERHETDFRLYILCLDEAVFEVLSALQLKDVVLIQKKSLFPDIINAATEYMTPAQICWLSQPLLCRYVLDNFQVDHIVYMDSDCYFMSSPEPLWREIEGGESIAATMVPHRFSKGLEYLAPISGQYCVQFNYFDKTSAAAAVLERWTGDCLKYNKNAAGIYPGQISLDSWKLVSDRAHSIENIWAGVAVWNLLNVDWAKIRSNPIIFYHFHGLYFMDDKCDLGNFIIPQEVVKLVYKPYIQELLSVKHELEQRFPGIEFLRVKVEHPEYGIEKIRSFWRKAKRSIKKKNNVFRIQAIKGL